MGVNGADRRGVVLCVREGYLFVNLQSAVLHLQHLSPDDVNLSNEEFRRYVLCTFYIRQPRIMRRRADTH